MTSVTIYSYRIFFLIMRNFKIYSFSNFQICNIILLAIHWYGYSLHAIHYIPCFFFILSLEDWKFIPLIPFTYSAHLPSVPLVATTLFSVFMCLFIFFSLDFIYEIICHLSFSVYLISLKRMPSRSTHLFTNVKITFIFMAE